MKHFVTGLAATLWLAITLNAHGTPAPTRPGIGGAPSGLVTAIARTFAKEAGHDPAYTISPGGCAKLKAQRLTACFGARGPAFTAGTTHMELRLTAWGRADDLHPVRARRSRPKGNRIAYRSPGILEWWRVLPLGYEQGFTLARAPAGRGPVVLQLRASVAPTVTKGTLAWGALHYGKVQVTDADGRVLAARLTATGDTVRLAFAAGGARYPVTVDPLVWIQQEVAASDGVPVGEFGYSVALSSDGAAALVGAPNDNGGKGEAYEFKYDGTGGTWSQTKIFTAYEGEPGDQFGWSVALSSDGATAVVGAPGVDGGRGVAYVFNDTYTSPAYGLLELLPFEPLLTAGQYPLIATDGKRGDAFGYSVALSGDAPTDPEGHLALVGAAGNQVNKAYVFNFCDQKVFTGGGLFPAVDYEYWCPAKEFAPPSPPPSSYPNELFGSSVALSGDGATALVGAPHETFLSGVNDSTVAENEGAAYVFFHTGTDWSSSWSHGAPLVRSDAAGGGMFGSSVALSSDGTTALVGAVAINGAYVFTCSNSSSSCGLGTALPSGDDAAGNSFFGNAVALSGDGATAVVGAPYGNSGRGAAYVFNDSGGTWSQTSALTASDGASLAIFGQSVALASDGSIGLVGAPGSDGGSGKGAAYLWKASDLSVEQSTPIEVAANSQFSSQYFVTNNTAAAATSDIQVQLPLPASGATYVSASATQGKCNYDSTGKVAICDLGSIPGNGTRASATLTLTATGAAGTNIVQHASLANGSPNLAATATTAVEPPTVPTVGTIDNVSVISPNAGTATLTLTGTGSLTVTATSTNTTLLPDAAITGASACTKAGTCTLTLTPAVGQTGTAAVRVTVSDSYGQQRSGSFSFTATEPPPPTVGSIDNVSVTSPHAGTASVTLIGAGPLTVTATSSDTTLLPDAAITEGPACTKGGVCSLTLTPAAGQSGTATVAVTVSDSYGQQATGSFSFTVAPHAKGGGTLGPWSLLLLGVLGLARCWQPRRGTRRTVAPIER